MGIWGKKRDISVNKERKEARGDKGRKRRFEELRREGENVQDKKENNGEGTELNTKEREWKEN